MNYQPTNLSIEGKAGLVTVPGYTANDTWNGWAVPMFDKPAMLELVRQLPDVLEYDEQADTVREVFNPDYHAEGDELDKWPGGYNSELKQTMYAIGAYSWTWMEER